MKELDQKYIDVLEELEWRVSSYYDDSSVDIENWSPAGEDLIVSAKVDDFPASVREYYLSFDIDEHVEMWVEAKHNDRDGHMGIPDVVTLVDDARAIDKMLEELSDRLGEVMTDDEE